MKRGFSGSLTVVVACVLGLVSARIWMARGEETNEAHSFGTPNTWKISERNWVAPHMALAPDGNYVAALCPARGVEIPTPVSPTDHELSPRQKELVIWRVSDQSEIARVPVDYGYNLVWSQSALALDDRFWSWKDEKLASLDGLRAKWRDPMAHWLSLDGDLYLEQMGNSTSTNDLPLISGVPQATAAPYSTHAIQISKNREIPLAPNIMRRVQDLPPDSQSVPALENPHLILDSAPFDGAVRVVVSREVAGEASFGDEGSIHRGQISAWDLVSGRRLWQRATRFRFHAPSLLWSPNGRWVAIVGVLSPSAEILQHSPTPKPALDALSIAQMSDNGIEIVDALTGQSASQFTSLTMGRAAGIYDCQWSGGALGQTFVINDWIWIPQKDAPFTKRRFLRFFDASNGRETKRWDTSNVWPLEKTGERSAQIWSVGKDGQIWALATTEQGLRVFQNGEFLNLLAPKTSKTALP